MLTTTTAVVCGLFLWSANPVHGVLTLVAAGLLLAAGLLAVGLEFSALIVVLVYVGAVTVLFVFVVMMVNLRATPAGYITAEATTVVAIVVAAGAAAVPPQVMTTAWAPPELTQLLNLGGVGYTLYATSTVVVVVVAGLLLWVAMISAICLSLVGGETYRTQEFYSQIRKPNAVFVLQQ